MKVQYSCSCEKNMLMALLPPADADGYVDCPIPLFALISSPPVCKICGQEVREKLKEEQTIKSSPDNDGEVNQ